MSKNSLKSGIKIHGSQQLGKKITKGICIGCVGIIGFVTIFHEQLGLELTSSSVDLIDIICNHHAITSSYKGDSYNSWLPDARDDTYNMVKGIKNHLSNDKDVAKRQEAMAKAFYYVYWTNEKHKSPIPNEKDIDYEEFAYCLTGEDFDSENYEYYKIDDQTQPEIVIDYYDETYDNLQEYLNININEFTRSQIRTIASTIIKRIGNLLEGYDENTFLEGNSQECKTLWNQIYLAHQENPSTLSSGCWKVCGTTVMQCTDFASWRLWIANGGEHGTAGGEGKNVAKNLVTNYPNEYTISYEPASGAIFSAPATTKNSSGHVGYVEKVEGEDVWISDGNVMNTETRVKNGIRINYKMSKSDFKKQTCHGGCTFAVPKS